ncbi:MAG: mannosyltransferase family protein [Jiangellaceae bacterium]
MIDENARVQQRPNLVERGRARVARLPSSDRDALLVWLASRGSVWVVAGAVGWLFATDIGVVSLLERWQQWDFHHFWGIALYGYGGEPTGVPNEAFFPGFPSLLALGAAVGLPHVAAGLLVSFVAGGVAAVALARLGDLEGGPGVGRLAVLMWVFAPPAVFLAAPYTESLFLGFAIPAWLCARRGMWAYAGLLSAAACTVRVSGAFLLAALGVHWLTSRERRWTDLPWLLVPLIPLAAWTVYLRATTGDWLAWLDAQAQEWNREFTWPWAAFSHTWDAGFGGIQTPGFAWMFRAEIVAMAVGVAMTVALLVWRRWGEATWVGLQVVAFGTSFWYFSVPRATLLWWPLWITLAAVAVRRRWVLWGYLCLSVPLMAVWAAAFLTGRWAG